MLKKILSFALVFVANILFGQCTIEFLENNDTIYTCAGSPLILNTSAYIPIAIEDFSVTNNPIWDGVSAGAGVYTSPCGSNPNSLNNPYYWFYSDTIIPPTRFLTTIPLDLSYSSIEVCFDLKMAIQGDAAPCEGPDGYNEGVSLQYSIDNGLTWEDIIYMTPTGIF